ncbi:MAG TPA: BREX-1 system phosphatase PglZ type B [Verrucomicrobiota bacterium]|nr:BREX-1 system phosphatase PglZ type B [Verrucomicrobiota bacterium]
MSDAVERAVTFIEAVKESLAGATRYNSGDSVAPAAVLWTDAEGEWRPVAKRLRGLVPELLTLGDYIPEERTGPAIWMRCIVDGALPIPSPPAPLPPDGRGEKKAAVPVLYLPGMSRQLLRSPEECPDELKPLVELQYRGVVWTQVNGKDWTLEAFLMSENGGLGLELGRDQKTRSALLGALEALATTPIATLRGHKLEAEDFDRLMVGDTVRDLLVWISDAAGTRAGWDTAHWSAFCSRCRDEFRLDPVADGDLVAAERLGLRKGPWVDVWRRFTESPALYPGIPAALRRARPGDLFVQRDSWPDENEKDEGALRRALRGLERLTPAEGRAAVLDLDRQHGERRGWVWARMGLSPLALALEPLKTLAEQTGAPLTGDSPDAIANGYVKSGYRADDAVLRALAAVKSEDDLAAVQAAVRTLYLGWLDDTARNFQAAAKKSPLPSSEALKDQMVAAEPGECLLFVDGLRFDVAQRLLAKAHERQLSAEEGYRWAALPTVTPTAKPAVTPAAGMILGEQAGEYFCPVLEEARRPVTAERLREAIAGKGYQILHGLDAGLPVGEDARAWSEYGEFDSLGHKLQGKLAGQIDEQLNLVLDRVLHLLEAGWRKVRVVTDHGWLLAPGGLPALPLKKYMTECRWARCAVIREGAQADVPAAGWFWDARQAVAYAPGAYCFAAGTEYTHGGLSPQECVVPDLTFSSGTQGKQVVVMIDHVQWFGLRCRVVIKPAAEGVFADLRSKPNDPKTTVTEARAFDAEGKAGLLVEDENLAGTATSLVVFDATGRILCKKATIIGGEA